MSYHGQAHIDPAAPRALAICDRCGFTFNHYMLDWQYQWQGPRLQNQRILVCSTCMDKPQEQLRTIVLPADPIPIQNPRTENFTEADAPITGLGTNFGTLTGFGGINAAFNMGTNKPFTQSAGKAISGSSFSNYVGKQWNVSAQPVDDTQAEDQAVTVTRFTLYAPNDAGFSTSTVNFILEGSSDGSTWTSLYNSSSVGGVAETIDVTSGITGTSYSYHRINFNGNGTDPIYLAQFVVYGNGLSGQF